MDYEFGQIETEYSERLPDDYFIQQDIAQARSIISSCLDCDGGWCQTCEGAGGSEAEPFCEPCNGNGFCESCWDRLKEADLGYLDFEEVLNVESEKERLADVTCQCVNAGFVVE